MRSSPGPSTLPRPNRCTGRRASTSTSTSSRSTPPGTFSTETIAQRLAEQTGQTSLLNTSLTLFDGNHNVVARNDDYFGTDSFIQVHLAAGTYYIGVSASGNDVYDPTVADSGLGGKSQGAYELRLNFTPDVAQGFRTVAADGTDITGATLTDGQTFQVSDGQHAVTFEFDSDGSLNDASDVAVPFTAADSAATVAAAIVAAVNNPVSGSGTAYSLGIQAAINPGDAKFVVLDGAQAIFLPGASPLTAYQTALTSKMTTDFAHGLRTVDANGADVTGAKLTDGQTFQVSDGQHAVTFEFDSDGTLNDPSDVAVPFTAADNAATIAAAIVAAVNHPVSGSGTTYSLAGQAAISASDPKFVVLSGDQMIFLPGTSPLAAYLDGQAGQALDGDLDGITGGVYDFGSIRKLPTSQLLRRTTPCSSTRRNQQEPMTAPQAHPFNNIAAALTAAKTRSRPIPPNPIVRIVGNNTANDYGGRGIQTVTSAGGDITGQQLSDGQTFTISDGTLTVTFEFDTGNGVQPGNVAVLFTRLDYVYRRPLPRRSPTPSTIPFGQGNSAAYPLYVQAVRPCDTDPTADPG